jgi:uncharacterized protein YndB with AHSA1/START domain
MERSVLHPLDIAAEPATVFQAITTYDGEAGFWTSNNDLEPTVGSTARFGFRGAHVDAKMRIDALDPDKQVRWTNLGDFPYWTGTTITWELATGPEGAGTRLLFRHAGWPDDYPEQEFASVNFVWGQVLARLKGYCETGRPQPFFG